MYGDVGVGLGGDIESLEVFEHLGSYLGEVVSLLDNMYSLIYLVL